MKSTPQSGELWQYKDNSKMMVLILRLSKSGNLVLTQSLHRTVSSGEEWRGVHSFMSTWKPVTQENK